MSILAQRVIDELRAATGNLPPALIVKALRFTRATASRNMLRINGFTDDEINALVRATFHVLAVSPSPGVEAAKAGDGPPPSPATPARLDDLAQGIRAYGQQLEAQRERGRQ